MLKMIQQSGTGQAFQTGCFVAVLSWKMVKMFLLPSSSKAPILNSSFLNMKQLRVLLPSLPGRDPRWRVTPHPTHSVRLPLLTICRIQLSLLSGERHHASKVSLVSKHHTDPNQGLNVAFSMQHPMPLT